MNERRFDIRKLINAPVRLYHPELGRVDGVINDISEGGAAIRLNSFKNLNIDMTEASLFLRPINLDVLYSVSCIRQTESEVAVKFLE
jgi:PilZ domain-containing protein